MPERKTLGTWECAQCGREKPATGHQRRQKYCSKACMGVAYRTRQLGRDNTNFRYDTNCVCKGCGAAFKSHGANTYCSRACLRVGYLLAGRMQHDMGYAKRTDANQEEIVAALRKAGASVAILSNLGTGVPDLLVGVPAGGNYLLEVKNPKSRYGKKGANELQKAFMKAWPGPSAIVYNAREALIAVGLIKAGSAES